MDLVKHKKLFNFISPVYNLFFDKQVEKYNELYHRFEELLNLKPNSDILDIGCGTGAFSKTFMLNGHNISGVDISEKMLHYARGKGINASLGNVVDGLAYDDKSFDYVISAFVTHGLDRDKRNKMLLEASRLSKELVIIHDYSEKSNILIKIAEFLENGDYFNFIKTGLDEMNEVFSNVKVLPNDDFSNWYICTP